MDVDEEEMTAERFLEAHSNQLTNSGVPQIYWHTLFVKLKYETYDAGQMFQMQQLIHSDDEDDDGADVQKHSWRVASVSESTIKLDDPLHIYLIDHAWTYRPKDARAALEEVPNLVERMVGLMDIEAGQRNRAELIDDILETMWRYSQTYRFGNFSMHSDDAMPMWYVMDEFGNRIQHSDDPNFKVIPFFYAGNGLAYSIMWPLKEVKPDDEVTRNYVEVEWDPDVRNARLLPWFPVDLSHVDFKQHEPSVAHFQNHSPKETLPPPDFEFPGLPKDRNLRVFVEYKEFVPFLTDPRFEVVDNPQDADILWYSCHFHEFLEHSQSHPHCLINQFPHENVITVKDLLAVVSRRAATEDVKDPLEANPKWLPVTYNLQTELLKFVSCFQNREKRGLDNHWICKPWNLARGMDIYVTKSLAQVMRLPDSGPKVACKYIENPVLYFRDDVGAKVKFDIRYIVLLSSVKPLKLYAYEVFWLRFANKPYSLDNLDDYEKHFTVMNYFDEGSRLKQVHYNEFKPEFEDQNPGFRWPDVENDIFRMIKELFQAAAALPPPQGICPSPQSRAMYAIDLMLNWDTSASGERIIQPMICEVNFSPDCARACKYHPFFANDVFSVLFLDDTEGKHVVPL